MTRLSIALCMLLSVAVTGVAAQDADKTKDSKDKAHLVFLDSSPQPKTIGVTASFGVSTDTILTAADGRLFHIAIQTNGFPDTTYPVFGTLPGYYTMPACTGQRYVIVSQVPPLVPGAYVRNQIAYLDPVQVVGNQWTLGIVSEAVAGFGGTTCQAFIPGPGPELPLGIPTEVELSQYGFVAPFRAVIR